MGLMIRQTPAQIGIDRDRGGLGIQTTKPRVEMTRKNSDLTIKSYRPVVEIDQTACFSNAGFKPPSQLSAEAAQKGMQQALEFIAKTASDGTRFAAIENGGNPIPGFAERDAFPEKEFGNGGGGMAAPRIHNEKWSLDIQWGDLFMPGMRNGVAMNVESGGTDIRYTPDKLRFYMLQMPSIRISYTLGQKIDLSS